MTDLRTIIAGHNPEGTEIGADTELADVLDPIGRVYDLPIWLEDLTRHAPTDAQMLCWSTVGDVERWVSSVQGSLAA